MSYPFGKFPIIEDIAKIEYGMNKLIIIKDGSFVICAVTGKRIWIEDLRYWSVKRQEAYFDAATSLKRELEIRAKMKGKTR